MSNVRRFIVSKERSDDILDLLDRISNDIIKDTGAPPKAAGITAIHVTRVILNSAEKYLQEELGNKKGLVIN